MAETIPNIVACFIPSPPLFGSAAKLRTFSSAARHPPLVLEAITTSRPRGTEVYSTLHISSYQGANHMPVCCCSAAKHPWGAYVFLSKRDVGQNGRFGQFRWSVARIECFLPIFRIRQSS